MFDSILIANRGEIARRVIRTARRLGLRTVVVFSDPDEQSPAVTEADLAVRLPGRMAAETYLDVDALLAAAAATGARAIHPGYGFLSENAGFARAVLDAGLVWIGPPPAAIAGMGSKVEAKQLMAAAGVPVLPELDPATVTANDLPVLIKASAGGGGRGMRIVRARSELADQLAAARAESASSFGSDRVFCEPYLAAGHHLEVQVLADDHGTVWAVGERECSIQRRHQKVIEEAPSPLVERREGLRQRLFLAAELAARAVDYRGAGTVEFIADDDGNFYFLEMNTRLQVEHPVTEATTGLDLVEWQLRIAAGQALPPEPPVSRGHAIEARLYAEDPAAGCQPQTGRFTRFSVADADVEFSGLDRPDYLRLDAGIVSGSIVSPYYDAMLAKVISVDPDRTTAARRLAGALRRAALHGPVTNRDQLVRVLTDAAFLSGDTDTAVLARTELSDPLGDAEFEQLAAIAAALADAEHERRPGDQLPSGWRNVYSQPQLRAFDGPSGRLDVHYRVTRSSIDIDRFPDVRVRGVTSTEVSLERAGVRHRLVVTRSEDATFVDSDQGSVRLRPVPRFIDPTAGSGSGSLLAPLPGSVLRLAVGPGQTVARGEPLLWIEAMKMEHPVTAVADGVVAEVLVAAGDQVAVGDPLVSLSPAQASEPGTMS